VKVKMNNIGNVAFLVGFFGDIFLQILAKTTPFDYGLRGYFAEHGSIEAPFIAGGMMVLFYIIYSFTGLPLKWQYIAVYGVLLDILFRTFMIFPSLKGYYSALTPFWTCLWEAVSMVLVIAVYSFLKK